MIGIYKGFVYISYIYIYKKESDYIETCINMDKI